ncbi:MAG: TetR/AcrR family transcriptional regulator [Candidatus Binatia bacterium]
MARRIPDDRFEQLVECATRVFIEEGYRRTQMADVAKAMGVAKGTLYAHVESKEALFDLVTRCADGDEWRSAPPSFPVRTPKPGATLRYVRTRLAQNRVIPALANARAHKPGTNAPEELEAIVRELYAQLARNRCGIKLLDRSARDYPELAALWFEGARGGLLAQLSSYLEARIEQGALRSVPNVKAAARLILETTVYWAVHRHWDSRPDPIPDDVACDTVVQFVVRALAKE